MVGYHHVRNDDLRRKTDQPRLLATLQHSLYPWFPTSFQLVPVVYCGLNSNLPIHLRKQRLRDTVIVDRGDRMVTCQIGWLARWSWDWRL